MKKILLFALLLPALYLLSSCSGGQVTRLDGAGATFPLPFYTVAFKAYHEATGIQVNYGGIGSGGGIRNLSDKIVDFAATDAFLTDEEMAGMEAVVHVPTCMGAVVVAFNLPGVDTLRLTGALVADIYLGKITKWNDARIVSENPDTELPDLSITPVYRSDGSGTTNVFSDYLTKVSPEWQAKVGSGKSLRWPVGLAAKGNPGVAGIVAQTPGAVGYVGSEYSFSSDLSVALLQNRAGNYIAPSVESITAAAQVQIPADTRVMITNSAAPEAYPISCFTWLVCYREQKYGSRSEARAWETLRLLRWMLGPQAQELTVAAHYAPLPQNVVQLALKQLERVTYGGAPLQRPVQEAEQHS